MSAPIPPSQGPGAGRPRPAGKGKDTKTGKSRPASSAGPVEDTFKSILNQSGYIEAHSERPLEEIFAEFVDAETALIKQPSLTNLDAYKGKIQEILKRIQLASVKVEKLDTHRRSKNKMNIIRVVNQKLDLVAKGLTSHVVKNPDGTETLRVNSAFVIMRRLTDIRGLIMDLMS